MKSVAEMEVAATPCLLFVSHQVQLEWFAQVAHEVKARTGLSTVLWTLGESDYCSGRATGAYDRVVNLLHGFDRFVPIGPSAHASNLALLSEYEKEVQQAVYHLDAALDRGLTGFTDAEVDVNRVRNRWTHQQIAALAVHILRRVKAELARNRVLASVGEANTLPYRLVYRLLKARSIPHFCPKGLPHADGGLYFEDDLYCGWERCRRKYDEFCESGVPSDLRARSEVILNQLLERYTKPEYFVRSRRGPRGWTERLSPRRVTQSYREWRWAGRRECQSNPRVLSPEQLSPLGRLVRALGAGPRKRYYEEIASKILPKQPYACYFLHEQPEYTVEGLAFEYQDQVAFVRNLVTCLPANMLLLVKEHRPQAGRRSLSFYGELASIPNVVLLHDTVNSCEVIKNAFVTLTLTGTVALESVCFGVPCVMFGNIYYSHFRGINRATSWPEFRDLVQSSCALKPATREEAITALAARLAVSYPANYPPRSPGDAQSLATALYEECVVRGITLSPSAAEVSTTLAVMRS
jgi:hypothetical protein